MRKNHYLIVTAFAFCLSSNAQNKVFNDASDFKPFKHMEVGVSVGTTGISFDVATPISKNVNIRAGVSFMPKIGISKDFDIISETTWAKEDDDAQRQHITNLCGYLSDMIGDTAHQYVDETIRVHKTVRYINAKVLVDWYPFKNKHWHFTAGLYYGSKRFANAINDDSEASTMVAINLYNTMYDKVQQCGEDEFPTFNIGSYSYELDPFTGQKIKDAFNRWGRVAVTLGQFEVEKEDGTTYKTPHLVTPDQDGVIRAYATSNALKPYLGCGYETNLGYDKRWKFGIEVGALFWGPRHVYTSDGVCLIHDVCDVKSVGSDVRLLKNLPVLPNIEVRLAYTIF